MSDFRTEVMEQPTLPVESVTAWSQPQQSSLLDKFHAHNRSKYNQLKNWISKQNVGWAGQPLRWYMQRAWAQEEPMRVPHFYDFVSFLGELFLASCTTVFLPVLLAVRVVHLTSLGISKAIRLALFGKDPGLSD